MGRLLGINDVVGLEIDGFKSENRNGIVHWFNGDKDFKIWLMATPHYRVHGFTEFELFDTVSGYIESVAALKMRGDGNDLEKYKEVMRALILRGKEVYDER